MQPNTTHRRLLAILTVVLALSLGAGAAFAQDRYWTNSSGTFGTSGNWSNGVPDLNTAVWFGNGQTFTVTMDGDYSTCGVIVTNGTVVTIDLNDGTARTWEAAYTGGLITARNPKIEVRGSTLIVTDTGAIDANNLPEYQAWPGLVLSGGSTTVISNGAYVNVGYVGGVFLGTNDTLIVTDPGTKLYSDDMRPTAGSTTIVRNGGYFNGVYWNGGGDLIVTGPGSAAQFGPAGIEVATSVTITGGGRVDAGVINTASLTIGGGSGVSTGQVISPSIGDGYNQYTWTVTTNGVLDSTGEYLEVRDGFSVAAQASILTLDAGTLAMQTNSQLRLKENAVYANDDGFGGVIRGTGTIARRTASGDNFKIMNEGLIQPGDTTAAPAMGVLKVSGGDLYQTNATGQMHFEFSETALDQINISGGFALVNTGTNVFRLAAGSPPPTPGAKWGRGTYDFIIGTNISYRPAHDNLISTLTAWGLTQNVDYRWGVVDIEGGRQALRLEFAPGPAPVDPMNKNTDDR